MFLQVISVRWIPCCAWTDRASSVEIKNILTKLPTCWNSCWTTPLCSPLERNATADTSTSWYTYIYSSYIRNIDIGLKCVVLALLWSHLELKWRRGSGIAFLLRSPTYNTKCNLNRPSLGCKAKTNPNCISLIIQLVAVSQNFLLRSLITLHTSYSV